MKKNAVIPPPAKNGFAEALRTPTIMGAASALADELTRPHQTNFEIRWRRDLMAGVELCGKTPSSEPTPEAALIAFSLRHPDRQAYRIDQL